MSQARRKTSYLSRRGGIYYLRVRVPHDLVERVGRFEIRRSLGVARLDQARLLAARYAARVFEVFRMVRSGTYSKAEIAGIVQSIFADLYDRVERQPFVFETCDPDEELAAQLSMSEDYEAVLLQALDSFNPEKAETAEAKSLLAKKVLDFEQLPSNEQHDLLVGAMRALIEQQRMFRFRLKERLLPYETQDELFHAETAQCNHLLPIQAAHAPPIERPTGPTVADLVDRYLAAKQARCTCKTIKMMSAKLELLIDHLGQQTHVSEVSIDDMRSFRDGVLRLRKSNRGESGSFQERQTNVATARISLKTASTTFKTIRSFWNWVVKESYVEASPVASLSVDLTGYKKLKQDRRPFAPEEIEKLFSAPLFTGCRSRFRRFEAGNSVIKDAKFWMPILGYYTGARLGELVQLHIADIVLDHDIPHISINDDYGNGHVKHLKSDAAEREIPIHPDLIALGFDDFVGERAKSVRKSLRLFHEVKFGEDGQASTVYSKWFARFMDKCGLSDRRLVFHSFRHGVQDIYRSSLAPQYLIDAIFGHEGTQTSDGYSHDIGLEAKLSAMVAAKWPVGLPELLNPLE